MTANQTAPSSAGQREPQEIPMNRPTGLIVTVSVLALVFVALSGWALTINFNSDSGVPADVIQAIEDYNDAWNSSDGEAFVEMTTDDYIMHTERFGDWTQRSQARQVGDSGTHDWLSEWIGRPTGTGDGPWYVARATHLEADMYPPEGIDGLSTFKVVVDDEGLMKIARHTFQAQFME